MGVDAKAHGASTMTKDPWSAILMALHQPRVSARVASQFGYGTKLVRLEAEHENQLMMLAAKADGNDKYHITGKTPKSR